MSMIDRLDDIFSSLKHDPEKEDNWTPLTELLRDPDSLGELTVLEEKLDKLIAYFERYDDWDYVTRLLMHRIELEEGEDVRADLALKQARILDTETFDARKAKEMYEEVLRLRPGDGEASSGLNELKELKKKWRDVVEQYLREAGDADQGGYKSNLYLQVAGLYHKYGGKKKETIRDVLHYLQLALEADPANKSASGFLKRLLTEDRQWEDLVMLYQRLAEVAKTREDRVDAMVQRARILAGKMERTDEAAEVYSQVLELHPGN
jgi:tetratricopeptide (TPR) repeat protein